MRTVPPLADLRLDAQREADVLALDGLERVGRAAGAGVGERAGDERHVLADDDLGLLVVERDQVRRRQDVGVGVGLAGSARARRACRSRRTCCSRPMFRPRRQAATPASRRAGDRRRRRSQVEDVAGAGAEVGAAADDRAVALARRPGPATGSRSRPPCSASTSTIMRLDVDLRAARVELVDHGAQLPVQRLGRGDDQRVGRRVGLDEAAGRRPGRRRRRGAVDCGDGAAGRAGAAGCLARGAPCCGALAPSSRRRAAAAAAGADRPRAAPAPA